MLPSFKSYLLATTLLCSFNTIQSQTLPNRYNVIFISIDDMADKTNYLGYPAVLTPNLQRLIDKSTAFTNAYCQYPLCNPSRMSVMSGWRPDKTHIMTNNDDPAVLVPQGVHYLQDLFHSYGYRTERYGKIYHDKFEKEFNWDFKESEGGSTLSGDNSSINASSSGNESNIPGSYGIDTAQNSTTSDYRMVTDLIHSLKKPSAQPRFFALGLGVHNPFTPGIDFWNVYGNPLVQDKIKVYGSDTMKLSGNSASTIRLPRTPPNDRADVPYVAFFPRNTVVKTDSVWKQTVQAYYAEVSRMDYHLGLLLDELDRQNLWLNTVIVFVSDHGQHLGEHDGLWLKNSLFQESLHVPLIIYAPGFTPAVCNKIAEEVDIYPTLTELCKLPAPTGLQGVSLARMMANPAQQWKKAAFSQVIVEDSLKNPVRGDAVSTSSLHYNTWGAFGEELYDKTNDPKEYTNQVGNPAYATQLQYMRNLLSSGWENTLPPPCDSVIYYPDNDNDGFGNTDSSFKGCYQPTGYIIQGLDCNDNNYLINPNAPEICDGIDNNCNGLTDENGITASITPAGSINLCSGQSLVLTANAGGNITYQWFKNNVVIVGATGQTLAVTTSGKYSVKEISINNCSTTSLKTTVTLLNKPAAHITALGNLDICSVGSVVLQANSGVRYSYQWQKSSTDIIGATGMQYIARNAGNYFVVVTDSNGCSKKSAGVKVTTTCFAMATSKNALQLLQNIHPSSLLVSPNPTTGKITVTFYSIRSVTSHLKVYDLTGRQVFNTSQNAIAGNNKMLLQLPRLAAGIYYLEIINDPVKQRIRFVVSQ